MEQNTPLTPTPQQGPVVGIIVVIVVLIVGAFYFFTQLWSVNAPVETATTTADATFAPVSSSDDPDAIASDLQAEDFSNIDAEMNAIDAEANQ